MSKRLTPADIQPHAESCLYAGTMCLMPVLRVVQQPARHAADLIIYSIHLKGGILLAATPLHAFRVWRGTSMSLYCPAHELERGDHIWVDVSALCADGSMYKPARKCRRPDAVGSKNRPRGRK
jgi:hypothetical protein